MTWEYSLVDEGWDERWVPELIEYAKQRNVGIILWHGATDFTEDMAVKWASWARWA